MNEALSTKWGELRGLKVVSVALGSVTLPDEDAEMIKQAQRTAMMRDPTMAAATLVGAQSDAMKSAAANPNGAMMGFMGMGMAQQTGGMNAQNLFQMGAEQRAANQQNQQQSTNTPNSWKCSCGMSVTGKFCPECGSRKPEPIQEGAWKCSKCGTIATGKFCPECANPKPVNDSWTCSCGTVNTGKFCQNCGNKRPEPVRNVKCSKCGWEPEDPTRVPKFCPECGNAF